MTFKPEFKTPSSAKLTTLWFVFDRSRLLVKGTGEGCTIPDADDIARWHLRPRQRQYLGSIGEHQCFAAEMPPDSAAVEDCQLQDLRTLFGVLDETLIWIAGRANQLVNWNQSHRFCGHCGHATEDKRDERAKICPVCGLVNYPRLSPAVIVAVIKDKQILLARNKRFKRPFYSVLAGFVEPGETLEECVRREVMEEVGLTLGKIQYFGSQPWPFPDSLMIGFVAHHASGQIRIDNNEIMDAAWFSRDELPRIPPKISIARQLIDWFTDQP
jgi:NAD+ diphosphatase